MITRIALIAFFAAAPMAAQVVAPTAAGYRKEFGTMWTFDAPPLEYWKATYNFAPDQAWLDNIRLASVRLPNCSSSIISSRGLVLTNHHCARSCISSASPRDTNYIDVGFVASSMADERRCQGLYVDQLQSIEDVTAQIRTASRAATATAQAERRTRVIDSVQTSCQRATGLHCQVVTLYQGGMYSLYRYKRYEDVRLVMAPEEGVAFFGGDPDNFTYPRYCLDISLLRIYENGQPLAARNYLRWSSEGRDKLSRAFENVHYSFDILGNLGLYRDLHRHRILTQERQEFTTVHGYDTPPEIHEAGFTGEFAHCMERAAQLYERIYRDLPGEAQYVVPFAYKIRWYMKMNLREAVHLCELRTMPQGHPDYRFICQEMWRKIQSVHPALAESGKFMDWQKYRLGRLQSELRTEFKKSALSQGE